MIQWTIPTSANTHSFYYLRYSSSQSNYYTTILTGGQTTIILTATGSNPSIFTTENGTTQSSSYSSSFTGYTYYIFDGTNFSTEASESRFFNNMVGIDTDPFVIQSTESFSSITTNSFSHGSAFYNTSTTFGFQTFSTFTLTRSSSDSFFTTSKNGALNFITTSRSFTRIASSSVNTTSSFKVVTGLTESTVFAQDKATVYEVSRSPQIIYVLNSRPTSWSGYEIASLDVTTRTTIEPVYSTTNIILNAPTTTYSTSVEEITSSYAIRDSRISLVSTTEVQNFNILPNPTVTYNKAILYTTQITFSWTLLSSSIFNYGETFKFIPTAGGFRTGVATTTEITSWLTSVDLTTLKTGNVTIDNIIEKPYSTSFISTTLVGVYKTETFQTIGVDSGVSTHVGVDISNFGGSRIFGTRSRASANSFANAYSSEEFASSIITLIGPPQVIINVTAIGPQQVVLSTPDSFKKFKEVTMGVVIDGEEGGMFTAPQSLSTLFTARDGNGTLGRTLMPTTHEFFAFSNGSIVPKATYAANGRSISYSSLNGTNTNSFSFVVGVSGETQTTNNGNDSEASVTEIGDSAVYVDKVNGQTTSFNGGNTTYTGTTQPYRVWTNALGLGAPTGIPSKRSPLVGTTSLKLDQPLGYTP